MANRFDKFHAILAQNLPQFKIAFKSESSFMKFLNVFVRIFNKNFMTDFITTIGYTVYFPNREYLNNDFRAISILAHEYVHAIDAKSMTRWIYGFLYLAPFSLFFIMIWFGFLWWPIFLISLIFLLPLPAPARAWAEMRGYTMTLFILNEIYKERGMAVNDRKLQLSQVIVKIDENFTGFNYYLMWPFGKKMKLEEKSDKIISGDILKEDAVYKQVQMAFLKSKN